MFKKMLLLMTVVLLCVSCPVFAEFYFWTGAVSTDPTDPCNWGGGLPGKDDVACVGIDSSWATIIVADNPVLTSEYAAGDPNGAGWWIMWGQDGQNGLTVGDGAYMQWSKNDCNLRNGAYLKVTGRNSDGGPSLVIPPTFRIGQQGNDVENYGDATSTIIVEDDGYLRFDPSVAVKGSGGDGILMGGEINALIEIKDDGILELVSGTHVGGAVIVTPRLVFASSDPAKNKVVISGNGQLLLAGDPATIGDVNGVATSLDDIIAMGLITSDTGITVSGSDPTVVTAVASPFTIVDLPATGTDAAIGIDAGKTYTHAFDFGTNAPAVINGVALEQGPTANIREPYVGVSSQGYGYIIDDTRADVKINCHGGNDASDQADGNSVDMLQDMIYFSGANVNEGIVITLQDLMPGTKYSVRWYYRAWDPPLPRPITVVADSGDSIDINIDKGGAHYLDYTFVADDNDVTITFICNDDNQGAHIYGLTCEEVPAPELEVAGELLVDVSAADPSAGTDTWVNYGTLGDFTFITAENMPADSKPMTPSVPPVVEEFEGVPVVNVMSTKENLVAYAGPISVPGIEGDSDRSIEAWVADVNDIPSSQAIIAWGHRSEAMSCCFSYGWASTFGALIQYGDDYDVPWGNNFDAGKDENGNKIWGDEVPTLGTLHHLVYTYEGTMAKLYVDGQLVVTRELGGPLNTTVGLPINLFVQNNKDTGALSDNSLPASLLVNSIRVHDGVLTDAQVLNNYEVGPDM